MEWLKSGLEAAQKQAQEAAEKLMLSDAANRAKELAIAATEQARVLAEQATEKAREVAKVAAEEAEKGLADLRGGANQPVPFAAGVHGDPQYGITDGLDQFVRSLTYSTFSDFPCETLAVTHNSDGATTSEQRLTPWQEGHARLMLQRCQPLQDLRFVLCPRRMDEFTFWQVYFVLCRRYLPEQAQLEAVAAAPPAVGAGQSSLIGKELVAPEGVSEHPCTNVDQHTHAVEQASATALQSGSAGVDEDLDALLHGTAAHEGGTTADFDDLEQFIEELAHEIEDT